ncbi:MAG: hypothetical protein ACI4OE_06900 [Alphaproteobacteria bacterium]
MKGLTMSDTVAVRLSCDLIKEAARYAKVNLRSLPKQIEYWAMLGRCAEDNPDLPLEFIKECLLAKEDIVQGNVSEFSFRKD